MKRITLVLLGLTLTCGACGGGSNGASSDLDAGGDATIEASPYAAECADADVPPGALECTGLYSDLATKQIAPGVRSYAPAVPLWADNAEKERWIWLPPGTPIAATDPNE